MRQLGLAETLALGSHRLPGLRGERRNNRGPRRAFFCGMLLQPLLDIADQSTPAMVCRVQAAGERVYQPVFVRLAGKLPLQHPFAGEAAADLHHNLRLLQLADRRRITQPQIGAGQRLPGLRQYVANQRPAQRFGPFGDAFALFRAHAPRHHYAAFLPPEEPVALDRALLMQRFAQPGFISLPPVAQRLLPGQPGVIHIAVQRFRERAINVDAARMQRPQRIIHHRYQPASWNILARAR